MYEVRDTAAPIALIVEDDPEQRALLRHFLHHRNFLALAADNGRDALEIIARTRVDLLLTDVHMPVMDGIQVVTALRTLGYLQPILVLTSDNSPGMESKAAAAGADGCLWKPLDFALLENWLEKALV